MKIRHWIVCGLVAVGLAGRAEAAVVLLNGSFETTTGGDLGSALFAAANWTNLSPLPIQASSAAAGFEFMSVAGATGARVLRLASDNPDPANTGFIVQNMGTMVAGQTYTITGDLLGGAGRVNPFSLVARLASDSGVTPSTIYAEQTTAGLASGAVAVGGLALTYAATAGDEGKDLYIWLRAAPSIQGSAVRGGVDNLVLQVGGTSVPEPGTFGLMAAGLVVLLAGARRR
jgi:hypothetical protein